MGNAPSIAESMKNLDLIRSAKAAELTENATHTIDKLVSSAENRVGVRSQF